MWGFLLFQSVPVHVRPRHSGIVVPVDRSDGRAPRRSNPWCLPDPPQWTVSGRFPHTAFGRRERRGDHGRDRGRGGSAGFWASPAAGECIGPTGLHPTRRDRVAAVREVGRGAPSGIAPTALCGHAGDVRAVPPFRLGAGAGAGEVRRGQDSPGGLLGPDGRTAPPGRGGTSRWRAVRHPGGSSGRTGRPPYRGPRRLPSVPASAASGRPCGSVGPLKGGAGRIGADPSGRGGAGTSGSALAGYLHGQGGQPPEAAVVRGVGVADHPQLPGVLVVVPPA